MEARRIGHEPSIVSRRVIGIDGCQEGSVTTAEQDQRRGGCNGGVRDAGLSPTRHQIRETIVGQAGENED